MHIGEDAKRQSLLRFELFKKIDKFLSLNFRNILISPLEGEKKFLSELRELSNKGRLGILAQREAGFEPSPAFVMLTGVRKRLLPLTKREGCDSVISSDFKSKISITNENNLSCKELSALVPRYLSNFSDTVFSRFTSHFSRKRTAFTLAEVFITLGIIGIVAALTLPTLTSRYQEKVFITRLEKTYSILVSAYKLAVEENGSSTGWGLSFDEDGATLLAEKMKPYLNVTKDCGIDKKQMCLPDRYYDYKGQFLNYAGTQANSAYVVALADGTVLQFRGQDSSHALFPDGFIYVDLNGKKRPNRYGVDVFGFDIYDDTLSPMGQLHSKRNTYGWSYCKSATEESILAYGWACTAWVLVNKNMDYIRCRNELDWGEQTSCPKK